jgi:hypothetical protein
MTAIGVTTNGKAAKRRTNTIVCALLVGAAIVPVAHAGDRRSPVAGRDRAALQHKGAFANLGHEGSGRHASQISVNSFANLGHEGSGLEATFDAAKLRPWAT